MIIYHYLCVDRLAMRYADVRKALDEAMLTAKDKLKHDARKAVFISKILPRKFYHKPYQEEYDDIHKYEKDVDGLAELDALIRRHGWNKFIVALEWWLGRRFNIVKAFKRMSATALTSTVTKVKGLPKWPNL